MIQYSRPSEARFADYLGLNGHSYTYEPDLGISRRPDFLVGMTGQPGVVCEVTDITKPLMPDGVTVASVDPYEQVRRKINEKEKQARGLKGRYPFVIVLWFEQPHGPCSLVIPGALFGNIAVEILIDTNTGGPVEEIDDRLTVSGGGRLQPGRNTKISAVAVLNAFNPTRAAVERAVAERVAAGERTVERVWQISTEEYDRPTYDAAAVLARLDVFHNPYAALPLESSLFTGPHDAAWDLADGGYRRTFTGHRFHDEVPDSQR